MVRICQPGGEGMFIGTFSDNQSIPDFPTGFGIGILMTYCFLGVAIISDIFMGSIETVTSWKKKVKDKETGQVSTVNVWNGTVATLTLMALGSSAPEIFLAVIENFKKGFHSGDLGPSTIVGSAAFNLFSIIAVCVVVIPKGETRVIENVNAFLVTAVFSIGAYMWMVFVLVMHGADVVDIMEAAITLLLLPALVWTAYSTDVGIISRKIKYFFPDKQDDEDGLEKICHQIGFASNDLVQAGQSEEQSLDVVILRKGPARTKVSLVFRTERLSAVPGFDFEQMEGEVEFQEGEDQTTVKLGLLPKAASAVSRQFLLILENGDDGCGDFDPDGDGSEDAAILTITVDPPDGGASTSCVDRVFNKNSLRYALNDWVEQFTSLRYVNGSAEDQAEASKMDCIYHVFALPWNAAFAFVPPASFFGGWLCFVCAICGIGLITGLISDVAEMFGCLLDIPDIVTATIFVALGTSMPDLFASLGAAVDDPTADAAIVNVTGSNSVNVFLGLGIPWLSSSIYWRFVGERDADWEGRYPEIAVNPKYANLANPVFVVESRNLGFCVLVYTGLCVVAILLLILRRKFLGCELGGPTVPKYTSGFLLALLWISFVGLSSWRVLRCEGAAPGTWCAAPLTEQMVVCASVFFVITAVAIPTLISICYYSKEAKAMLEEEKNGTHNDDVSNGTSPKLADSHPSSPKLADGSPSDGEVKLSGDAPNKPQLKKSMSNQSLGSGAAPGGNHALKPALTVHSRPVLKQSRSSQSLGSASSTKSQGSKQTIESSKAIDPPFIAAQAPYTSTPTLPSIAARH